MAVADEPLVIRGEGRFSGAYILRIAVARRLTVRFGRYAGSAPVTVERGELLYIGSAFSAQRGHPLAARVARHLTRTAPRPPHRLLAAWQAVCVQAGVAQRPGRTKRCRWHIDYLLDETAAEVVQVIALRTPTPSEQPYAQWLESHPAISPLAVGLGAGDHPGHTHLLRFSGDAETWSDLVQRMQIL